MVAEPVATPVTTPLSSTVALLVLLLDHETTLSVALFGATVAFNLTVFPIETDATSLSKYTPVTA